jgi:hypothetical protein
MSTSNCEAWNGYRLKVEGCRLGNAKWTAGGKNGNYADEPRLALILL